MERTESIQRAFAYLRERASDGTQFSLDDLIAATEWSEENTKTNLTKRLSDFVERRGKVLRAKPEILRVRFSDFKDLFRQKQRLFTDYEQSVTTNVLAYEFFMPLSREDRLRETLDNLFYIDTIEQRVKEIGFDRIREAFGFNEATSDAEIAQFVCNFVNENIGGYSMYLVNGRFRAASLMSRAEAVQRPFADGPYLVDETTAVVRFILPITTGSEAERPTQSHMFEPALVRTAANEQADRVRWLFLHLFAEAITRVVKKEDEIWLLETGMRNALYKWVRRDE